MNYAEESMKKHAEWEGKIEVVSRVSLKTSDDLAIAYTPGVAAPCLEIQKNYQKSFELTRRGNLVAVITDGTAVLGLGDIGPEAGMPVMEGKCVLFKTFGGVDAIPLCIRSKNVDEFVNTVYLLSGSFGGINLEDISAPRCFEIERRLKQLCDVPVFHDDQHGTATVVLAALINAFKVTKKKAEDVTCVINGAGAAGIAICKLLQKFGIKNIIMCDSKGAIVKGNPNLNSAKAEIAEITNFDRRSGTLGDVIVGADIFIGVSAAGVLTQDMVRSMAPDPIVLAMANPVPEIFPDLAKEAGAAIVGTGRSDYPNQINNVLCFPGIFKGALRVRASDINTDMQIAAAHAIADFVKPDALCADNIIPSPLENGVADKVADDVAAAAIKCGLARHF